MSTPDDLRSDAIREMELDELAEMHEQGEHAENPQTSECPDCERDFLDAAAEHAWMGRAVQTWTGGNPYHSEPGEMARAWAAKENGE